MAAATMTINESQISELLHTLPLVGNAATKDPYEILADATKRVNESAFLSQLADVVRYGWELGPENADVPSDAAIRNAQKALIELWLSGLVPSAIVPSAEGGVGISLLNGSRQAHFECSNEGDFSLIMFDKVGEIEVISEEMTPKRVAAAMERARLYLGK